MKETEAVVDKPSSSPRATLDAFYSALSFEVGGAPDWARVSALFLPGARMTLPHMAGVDGVYSLPVEGWGERLLDDIQRNSIVSLVERELGSTEFDFHDVAHILSAFETVIITPAAAHSFRGVYSVQFVKDAEVWLIASMVWDFAVEGLPLPSSLVRPK